MLGVAAALMSIQFMTTPTKAIQTDPVPRMRILRTIRNGCFRLHRGGWPTRRQLQFMVRHRGMTAGILRAIEEMERELERDRYQQLMSGLDDYHDEYDDLAAKHAKAIREGKNICYDCDEPFVAAAGDPDCRVCPMCAAK